MLVTLNNGVQMPQLGFGVWKMEDGEQTVDAVKEAIKVGYRSIDTASIYKNEVGVGKAIRESGVPREELFITTKVWNGDQGYEETLKAFEESIERLGLEYIDLYLIHWPMPQTDKYVETYRALEKLYEDKKVRAIGVCNFQIPHLERILAECKIKPAVNQIECHPYFSQTELKEFCKKHDIVVEAWSPLMKAREILQDEVIAELANKYNKTPAQIILRWHLQSDVIAIPKSVTPSRIAENFDIFGFELAEEDMKKIDSLDRNERIGRDPDQMHLTVL